MRPSLEGLPLDELGHRLGELGVVEDGVGAGSTLALANVVDSLEHDAHDARVVPSHFRLELGRLVALDAYRLVPDRSGDEGDRGDEGEKRHGQNPERELVVFAFPVHWPPMRSFIPF